MNIFSEIKIIKDVLSENNTYHVTRFQREYAWEKDDLREFWIDINTCIIKKDDIFFTSDYFIGSIVMINQGGSTIYNIVDGQQRLTTISILLSVIIESLKSSNPSAAKAVYNSLIEGVNNQGKPFFKLKNENVTNFLNTQVLFYEKQDVIPSTEEEKMGGLLKKNKRIDNKSNDFRAYNSSI